MNLDVVSLMKNKSHMKSIIWGTSPETILMQVDFSDSSMDSNTTNNRDNGGTILGINSIETRGDHP